MLEVILSYILVLIRWFLDFDLIYFVNPFPYSGHLLLFHPVVHHSPFPFLLFGVILFGLFVPLGFDLRYCYRSR